jgi:hypothetical protein
MTEEFAMQQDQELSLRHALAGTTVLLVGGDPHAPAVDRLKRELKLAAVVHRPTRKSDPSAWRFASALQAYGYGLVVCARGLTRTQHGRDLHETCRELGLPLLNCNHIPHPNTLVAGVVNARLTLPVMRRCEQLKQGGARLQGGAA